MLKIYSILIVSLKICIIYYKYTNKNLDIIYLIFVLLNFIFVPLVQNRVWLRGKK